jgi:hypothetical protein
MRPISPRRAYGVAAPKAAVCGLEKDPNFLVQGRPLAAASAVGDTRLRPILRWVGLHVAVTLLQICPTPRVSNVGGGAPERA